jgi:hypothetical protein
MGPESDPLARDPLRLIAVYSPDRAWRSALARELRLQAVVVRLASRPAELTKCLSDGAVQLVVAGPGTPAVAEARKSAAPAAVPVLAAAPGETTEAVARRALHRR